MIPTPDKADDNADSKRIYSVEYILITLVEDNRIKISSYKYTWKKEKQLQILTIKIGNA